MMATPTKRVMAVATRATKRAMARVARVMATATKRGGGRDNEGMMQGGMPTTE